MLTSSICSPRCILPILTVPPFVGRTLVNHVPQVLVIQDARKDARFVNNPLVSPACALRSLRGESSASPAARPLPQTTGEPFVIFYCGSPIIASSGHRLGSL